MKIIGIDPGSRKTGIGVVEYDAQTRRFTLVHASVLRLDLETDLTARLGELAQRLGNLLEEHMPTQAVLEDVFAGEHARSALILGQARGAVLAILGLRKMPVAHVAPRRVKQALTGSGAASKEQVGEMVRALLKLSKKPAEDAADALGVAISYILSGQEFAKPKRTSKTKKQAGLRALAEAQGLL